MIATYSLANPQWARKTVGEDPTALGCGKLSNASQEVTEHACRIALM